MEAFDAAYLIEEDLKPTDGGSFDRLFMYISSMQVFDALTRGKRTDERRSMIDVFAARQAYKKLEMTGVGYIRGSDNPAGGLTKLDDNGVLRESV